MKPQQSNPADGPTSGTTSSSQAISEMDGNTIGTSYMTSPKFSSPFSNSSKKIKKFGNQDYDELRRRCQSRAKLFVDPDFVPSNRLLVDDNNQYIISYFGRTRFDGQSIEWLRPQVNIY